MHVYLFLSIAGLVDARLGNFRVLSLNNRCRFRSTVGIFSLLRAFILGLFHVRFFYGGYGSLS